MKICNVEPVAQYSFEFLTVVKKILTSSSIEDGGILASTQNILCSRCALRNGRSCKQYVLQVLNGIIFILITKNS
jgi:hypothetical protein